MTHGIGGWGIILIGILVMLGPGVVAAEMPRAVYYDTTQVAKVIGDPVPQAAESATAGDTTPSTAWSWGDPPNSCMDVPPGSQMPVGFATLRYDLIRR